MEEQNANELSATLQLSIAEINFILNTLAELPFKVSVDLIGKIKKQAESQFQQVEPE